jgi:predicted O-methyltransferase YrrM
MTSPSAIQTVSRRASGGVRLAVKGVKRPRYALLALSRLLQSNWPALVFREPGVRRRWRDELARTGLVGRLKGEMSAAFEGLVGTTVRGRRVVSGHMQDPHAELLWALVRERKPKIVVETGVCNGLSSAVMLEALELNGTGRLVSVDLPEFSDPALNAAEFWDGKGGAVIPAGKSVGWLAPEARRGGWRLVLGRSQEVLPGVLADCGPVDIFIHDSEHSYANQMFEFRLGFDALAPGGILVATDINWSGAFDDFWAGVKGSGARRAFVDHACALVMKPG